MKRPFLLPLLGLIMLCSCAAPGAEPPAPTPTAAVTSTPEPTPTPTPEPTENPAFAWTHLADPNVEDDRAAVDGLGHVPLDTLPQEVLDSLELVEEGPWEDMYGGDASDWCIRRVYTSPGLKLVTTAPTAAYLDYKAEMDKDNRELYPTEADFRADIEGEEGREWIQWATVTDDSYATRYGLKVGLTVEEAEALGYPLSTRKDYGAYEKLQVTVENGVITEMQVWAFLGRYIGKFFEM